MTYLNPIKGVNEDPFPKRRRGRKKKEGSVDPPEDEVILLKSKVDKVRKRLASTDRRGNLSRLREQQKQIVAAKAKGVEALEDLYHLSSEEVLPFFEE